MDEGYIKYYCNWTKNEIEVQKSWLQEFNRVRSKLIKQGLIGKIPNGPGFGNVSIRNKNNGFYISGTNTGHLPILKANHISLVTQTNIEKNTIWCSGLSQASSESMSHAAIYETCDWINAVIHVHDRAIWGKYISNFPTTDINAAYGTIEMANEIKKILKSNLSAKVLILGGHEDGLMSYGENLEAAFSVLENLFQPLSQKNSK